MKVLLADEHGAIRRGVHEWLKQVPGLLVAAELADGKGILDAVSKGAVDVVIMEICFANCCGLTVLKELKQQYPRTRVLVYTAKANTEVGVRAIKAGADGFLCKDAPAAEFMTAVREVAAGGDYISPELRSLLLCAFRSNGHCAPHERLSDREYEIALMLAAGKGPKEIGTKVGISRKTVTSHRSRILIKMNMKSDSELTIYFERNKPPDRQSGRLSGRQSVEKKPQYSPKPQPCRAPALHEGYFPLNGSCLPSPSGLR